MCCAGPQPRAAAPTPVVVSAPTPPRGPFPATRSALAPPTTDESRHLGNIRQITLDGDRNTDAFPTLDGTHLYVESRRAGRTQAQVFLMDADGRNSRRISPDQGWATSAVLSPGGDALLMASTHLDAQGIALPPLAHADEGLLELYESFVDGAEPRALAPAPGYDGEGAYRPDNGAVVFVSDRTGQRALHLWERASGQVVALPAGPGQPAAPVFSPAGDGLVWVARSPGAHELWRRPLPHGTPEPLTALNVHADAPVFLPDGTALLFSADLLPNTVAPGFNTDLFLMDLRTGRLERVTSMEGHDTLPRFSADGRTLWWTSTRQGGVPQVFAADWVP